MKIEPFEANIRLHDQVAVIDLYGEINALSESILLTTYQAADKEDIKTILLNFSEVSYINSTGIAVIINLLMETRRKHQRLLACGLSDHYLEIFNITRLAEFMDIFSDENSALASTKFDSNNNLI